MPVPRGQAPAQQVGAQHPQPSARQRAAHALNHYAEKLLRPNGLDDVADRALEAFSTEKQRNVVVLIGEVKRGKSTLANALVGSPGLTPTGAGTTTNIPIALGPANESVPEGKVALYTGSGSTLVDAHELDQWVNSKTGTIPVGDQEEAVLRAYCAVPNSKMGPAVVIDAPGIGGIDDVDPQVANDTAAQASVIVIVADSTAPLTKPEMNYIKAASESTESIVVAVTKTDKNLTRWRSIVDNDKALIKQHIGRDIPVIGVSSLLPDLNVGRHSGVDTERMEELSGIKELRGFIQQQFRGAENIPASNALRILVEGVRELDTRWENRLKVVREGASVVPELKKDLEKLETIRTNAEQWDIFLQRDITRARQAATARLDDELGEIRKKWTDIIDKAGMKTLRSNPSHFTAKIEQDFQEAAMKAIAEFVAQIEQQVILPRFPNANDRSKVIGEIQKQIELGEIKTSEVKSGSKDAFDPMMLMMGFSGGSITATALSSWGLAAALLGPAGVIAVGIGVGASWIGINFGFRAMRQGKQKLTQWLRETMGVTRSHAERSMSTITSYAQPVIKIRFKENNKAAIADLQKRIKEAQEADAQDREARKQEIAKLERNREVTASVIQNVEKLRAELSRIDTIPDQRRAQIEAQPQLAQSVNAELTPPAPGASL
ncbi:dynamin family protein [Corynebacterium aquatimens]|uniref:GTP-binding protein EngB required for normal cell division/gas vesicle protein n=1 Tax=Corynebacterium aquatimens TaxID=1190508 RepID=A0A931GY15_9CORY|nr:dynamin family protein [Corynebacterium aquatimens]MBG6123044.1 GTP-binding protein EngB required for normal cell division/gas vesicle protein [Corynebacterium aquatimens]WJY66622.1 Isoniazid-induced protein IniA [Corynebacterium aquatimens]